MFTTALVSPLLLKATSLRPRHPSEGWGGKQSLIKLNETNIYLTKVIYKSLMMMNTIKCQVRLSKVVWDGWKEFLPILHHFIYYYMYMYISLSLYIYIYMYMYMCVYIYIYTHMLYHCYYHYYHVGWASGPIPKMQRSLFRESGARTGMPSQDMPR